MQRLGKNTGKYFGEVIDIQRVIGEMELTAVEHGWRSEAFLDTGSRQLMAFIRRVPKANKRAYISAGIHGDEPAGPLAILRMLQEDRWPANVDIWLCPCLNPTGFPLNSRENDGGIDLNRQYLQPEAEEIRAHVAWLEKQPSFDVAVCLHEDWEADGFYVYELNPDHQTSYAKAIVNNVAEVCPIDMSSMIEGRPAGNGIIIPGIDPRSRPQWLEAF